MQQTQTEIFLQGMNKPRDRREAYVDEEGTLVIRVRSGSWWFEVYGRPGALARVDSEMAPVRQVLDALNLFNELMAWSRS